ncbi:uncharacterized protein LODBEIA_P48430 [Lodderomyces beijingensis]|uniref:SMP-30/Gluconolactonase/LRE-like region domain-containing protein n=1 Tax=Lodderomyces beijingensis TaxID=1775926 RepID=A0ABP0ZR32_9ASCO
MSIQLSSSNIFPEDYRGRLAEGATYDARNNTLLWVDIIVGEVHRVYLADLNKHEVLKWSEPKESIGFIGLTKNPDVVLVCGKSGLAKGDFASNTIEYFFMYPLSAREKERLRSNDGIIDPWGHLWIGLMTDFDVSAAEGGVKPEGKLLRITSDLQQVDVMLSNTLISNGLAFCNKGTKFYWTDSMDFTIWKFEYNHERNELSNKTVFLDTRTIFPGVDDAEPDGMVRTATGEIYAAVFNTGTIVHVDKQGNLIEKIHVPAAKTTCVTIGGQGGNELFITTANEKMDDFDAKIDNAALFGDLGGFLFRYQAAVDLKGQAQNIWGGDV